MHQGIVGHVVRVLPVAEVVRYWRTEGAVGRFRRGGIVDVIARRQLIGYYVIVVEVFHRRRVDAAHWRRVDQVHACLREQTVADKEEC